MLCFGLLFSVAVSATELPIRKHLTDATALNRKRAPLYAELTGGKSFPLSYELIAMENLAAIATLKMDLEAKKYLKKNIGVFHDDLIDMAKTPAFQKTFTDNLAPVERYSPDLKKFTKSWLEKIDQNKHEDVYQEIVRLLEETRLNEINQNCLTRHFLESIARSILNHQGHRDNAEAVSLPDPHSLLNRFLKLQIRSIDWAVSLDRRAFSIQKNNVPLFCQDVPAIQYKHEGH